jgi:O-antigen ligase
VVAGVVTGYANEGDGYGIALAVRTLAYVLLLPLVVVHVLRTRAALVAFAFGALALGVYKGFEGTIAWLAGAGHPLDEATLTYFAPTANLVLLLFLLGLAAAVGERLVVPRWLWAAAPFVAVALVFSYRRSFWIAALLGLAIVVLLGRQRHRFLPILAVLGIALWASVALTGGSEAQSLIVERAQELDLSRVASNPTDRYRLSEVRNVTREIRESPLTGIGLGVPWTVEHSFPYEPGARNYTHVAVLWYWLKLGLVGLAAYLWLMLTAARVAFRISQAARDRLLRVCGTTLLAAVVGIVLIEATATFTGANLRFTVVIGALLGWLAAAELFLHRQRDEQELTPDSG